MNTNYDEILESIHKWQEIALQFTSFVDNIHSWVENNKGRIEAYKNAFSDFAIWSTVIGKMEQRQIIFTDTLTFEMAKELNTAEDIEKAVWHYYNKNECVHLYELISRCKDSAQIYEWKNLYNQSITAFYQGCYQLSCTGLFALMDGLLADKSDIHYNQNFKKRFEAIEEKLDKRLDFSDIDLKLFCIYSGLDVLKDTTFGDSDFTKPEPTELINRHWVLHGRTKRDYQSIDVLKLLLTLDSIITLANLCDKPMIQGLA